MGTCVALSARQHPSCAVREVVGMGMMFSYVYGNSYWGIRQRAREGCVCCRQVVTEEAIREELEHALSRISGGEFVLPKVISITISSPTEDLSPEARGAFIAFLQRLHQRGVLQRGAAATERGHRHNNLHLQIMCMGEVASDEELLQSVLVPLFKDVKHIPELRGVIMPARGFHIVVKLHDDGAGDVTFQRMLGYVASLYTFHCVLGSETWKILPHIRTKLLMCTCRYITKDYGKAHYTVPWMCGGVTTDTLREAAVAYRQVSNKSLKNRTEVVPGNWLQRVQPFYDTHLFPLDMHFAQIVRAMYACG